MSDYDKTIAQLNAILLVRVALVQVDAEQKRLPSYSKTLLLSYARVIEDLKKMAKEEDDEIL